MSMPTKTPADPPPAKLGRKPIAEEDRAVVTSIRLTPARVEKLRLLGGAKWVSERIDKARLP